jgi:hypothetical protein
MQIYKKLLITNSYIIFPIMLMSTTTLWSFKLIKSQLPYGEKNENCIMGISWTK